MHPTLVLLIAAAVIVIIIRRIFPLRLPAKGFKYVHIENDGSARELTSDEREYLQEEFHPNDGARPYIKTHYWQKTPDLKMHGFLLRIRVPWWIDIRKE